MSSRDRGLNKANLFIGFLSFFVLLFLFWLIYFKSSADSTHLEWVSSLPLVNASLNSITVVFLLAGFYFIKKGNKPAHIKSMLLATSSSALFLVSYIVYHHFQGDTKFLTQGAIRWVYFTILISHILFSMALVPMVFTTLFNAATKRWEAHKKWARWTFPVWLYVSVTGVLVYIFVNFLNTPSA